MKAKTPKSKTTAAPKKQAFRLTPLQEAEVRRLAGEKFEELMAGGKEKEIYIRAAQDANSIVNSKGGAFMDFFADVLQEGIDLEEVNTGKKKDGTFVTEFRRIFLLGLRAREKRDSREAQKRMEQENAAFAAQVAAAAKSARKAPVRRVK